MKWDEPVAPPASTLSTEIFFNQYSYQYQRPMPIIGDLPTFGKAVSELLDAKVTMIDTGRGRFVYEGTLMDLALMRLRQAGLEGGLIDKEAEAAYRKAAMCMEHDGPEHVRDSPACLLAQQRTKE